MFSPQHTAASYWPWRTLLSWGAVWLSSNFRKQVSQFSNSGVLIVLMCCAFRRVIFFSNVCWSVGRLSFCSLSRHIIISIPEWDFSDLPQFLHQAHIFLSVVSKVNFWSVARQNSSNIFTVIFTNFSSRAWRLYWKKLLQRLKHHVTSFCRLHFCTQKVSFLPIGHGR